MKHVLRCIVLFVVSGCVTDPLNGSAVDGNVIGKSLPVAGYADRPSQSVQIQVLNSPGASPTNNSNWTTLTTATTSSQPANTTGTILYAYTATITPVQNSAQLGRWPKGKIVRLRAVAKYPDQADRVLAVFDKATFVECVSANSGKPLFDIGLECASPYSPLAVVSTDLNPGIGGNASNRDYLGRKQDSSPVETAWYYATIGAPTSLTEFRNQFGFAAGETRAIYYNQADLGFGRDMHCRAFPSNFGLGVACYVRNYGNVAGSGAFPANPTQALELAGAGVGHFATVAMVYRPPNGPNAVQFMVYGPDDQLTLQAPLDSTGEHKSIPNNCLSCHGIDATVTTSTFSASVSDKARFLPFDPFNFKFKSQGPFTLENQQDEFESLNALVALTPPTPAMTEFLKGLYGGVMPGAAGASPTDSFVPVGWSAKADRSLYLGVTKPFCRGCHLSSLKASLDFREASDFTQNIATVACGPNRNPPHDMPHAEQTLRNFWASGARAYLSQRFQLAAGNDCSP
jgi:hypothetical protein